MNNLSRESFINNDDGFQRFYCISPDALNKYALSKKMHAPGNQMPFLSKAKLLKAKMTHSK